MYDLVIIGGGVSGLAAAIYAGRFEMKVLLIAENLGGTVIMAHEVTNYPGFKKISGMDLAESIKEHAKEYKIEIKEEKVAKVEKGKDCCFNVFVGKKNFVTKSVIFATGTEWKKLDVNGEKEFSGKGVHYCALCDGAFYKNKVIGVVGGSDSAAKDALLLAEYGKKVYIIYRKDKIRAEPITLKMVEKNKEIEVINNTNVIGIKGNKFVNSVILDKAHKGSKELKIDAIFIDIGHIPLSGLAKNVGVKINEKDEIMIDRDANTNVKGIFAAGDVCDSSFKQVITGVAQGVTAAYSAYRYINGNKGICSCDDEKL